jgi:archaellum component FlaC
MNTATMNRQALEAVYEDLLQQLADISRQDSSTLSHSDQQILDQAWDDVSAQIYELDQLFESMAIEDANTLEDDRPDCSRCAGCAYCGESSLGYYDESDEV